MDEINVYGEWRIYAFLICTGHTLHPVVTSGGYSRVYHNEIVNGQI